jgi:hypothetical protein
MASNLRNYSTKSVPPRCNDTADAASVLSMTLLWPTLRVQLCKLGSKTYHLSGVIDTADAASAVSMTSLRQYDTAEDRDLEFERLWLPLQGISIKKLHRQIVLPYS